MVGALDDYRISLSVIGDDVDPDEISTALGARPTTAHRKGDAIHGRDGEFRRNAKSGEWSIAITSRGMDEPDFDTSLHGLLNSLTNNLDTWKRLSQRFNMGLFCGIFLTDSNKGFTISPELMSAIGDRELHLGLDIYGAELPQSTE